MLSRRKFIKLSAGTVAAAGISGNLLTFPREQKIQRFGFISGILEKELKGDWKTALKKAASFGYTEIETGGYLGESPESYLRFLNETGLKPVAGWVDFNDSDEKLKERFDLIHRLKMKIAVNYWPWYTGGPFRLDDCKKSVERLNYLGEKCSSAGLQFCWHNHDKEFISMEEGLPFDYLMKHTGESQVMCELDIYWAKKGGADPLALMKKYRGRFLILHIKDMAAGTLMDFACPGSGIIDFRPVFREAYDQGIGHFMVERDNAADGLACLETSAEYLKKVTF